MLHFDFGYIWEERKKVLDIFPIDSIDNKIDVCINIMLKNNNPPIIIS